MHWKNTQLNLHHHHLPADESLPILFYISSLFYEYSITWFPSYHPLKICLHLYVHRECQWVRGGRNNYKKLYTGLYCLGVFTFCTCCKILICLCVLLLVLSCLLCNCCSLTVCIVVVVLCVLLSYVYLWYCVGIAFYFTLDAGLLARSQYSEGPATGHLDTGFSWFPCA